MHHATTHHAVKCRGTMYRTDETRPERALRAASARPPAVTMRQKSLDRSDKWRGIGFACWSLSPTAWDVLHPQGMPLPSPYEAETGRLRPAPRAPRAPFDVEDHLLDAIRPAGNDLNFFGVRL